MARFDSIVPRKGDILKRFVATAPAGNEPVPRGSYGCRVAKGLLDESAHGTPGYRLTLEVSEGEYKGRLLFKTWYFTEKAARLSRAELLKFGLDTEADFRATFPGDRDIRCTAVVTVGEYGNDVKRITDVTITLPRARKPKPRKGGK